MSMGCGSRYHPGGEQAPAFALRQKLCAVGVHCSTLLLGTSHQVTALALLVVISQTGVSTDGAYRVLQNRDRLYATKSISVLEQIHLKVKSKDLSMVHEVIDN